jgi:Zn-finger nucleic acid-binding protein
MNCPACDRKLTATQVGSVTVDVCQDGCGGIWFDQFELQRVDEAHEAAGEHLIRIARDAHPLVDPARKRSCPRCGGIKLMRRKFNPKSSVEVDHCPNCGGYWLDAGELEKIREEQRASASKKIPEAGKLDPATIRYIYRMQIEMRSGPSA